jgi:hypothetical protein
MENRKLPALLAVVVIALAVIGFFVIGGDDAADEPTETTPTAETQPAGNGGPDRKGRGEEKKEAEAEVPTLRIEGGQPVGGLQEFEVVEGDEFRLKITTDAPDELHLHGYDLYPQIAPGKPTELVVGQADIGGVFELESHSSGVVFAELSVVPG